MDRLIQIMDEKYFPNWNFHSIKVELLRDIYDPIGDGVSVLIELEKKSDIPMDAHVTMSATDISGRVIWVTPKKCVQFSVELGYKIKLSTRMSSYG